MLHSYLHLLNVLTITGTLEECSSCFALGVIRALLQEDQASPPCCKLLMLSWKTQMIRQRFAGHLIRVVHTAYLYA
jgi:hypothetical protein